MRRAHIIAWAASLSILCTCGTWAQGIDQPKPIDVSQVAIGTLAFLNPRLVLPSFRAEAPVTPDLQNTIECPTRYTAYKYDLRALTPLVSRDLYKLVEYRDPTVQVQIRRGTEVTVVTTSGSAYRDRARKLAKISEGSVFTKGELNICESRDWILLRGGSLRLTGGNGPYSFAGDATFIDLVQDEGASIELTKSWTSALKPPSPSDSADSGPASTDAEHQSGMLELRIDALPLKFNSKNHNYAPFDETFPLL